MAQRPQCVGQCRRRRVVPGQHEDQQVVADLVVGQRLPGLRVGGGDQGVHQGRVAVRVGAAGLQDLIGDRAHRRDRGAGPRPRRGGQPARQPQRSQRAVGGVRRRDVHVLADDAGPLVEVDTQHGPAQRLHGHAAAFGVEVDRAAVTPAVDGVLRGPGHVAAERPHVLFGEHRLQRALAGPPFRVGQHEQAVTGPCAQPLRGRCTALRRRRCGPARHGSRPGRTPPPAGAPTPWAPAAPA